MTAILPRPTYIATSITIPIRSVTRIHGTTTVTAAQAVVTKPSIVAFYNNMGMHDNSIRITLNKIHRGYSLVFGRTSMFGSRVFKENHIFTSGTATSRNILLYDHT